MAPKRGVGDESTGGLMKSVISILETLGTQPFGLTDEAVQQASSELTESDAFVLRKNDAELLANHLGRNNKVVCAIFPGKDEEEPQNPDEEAPQKQSATMLEKAA